ncbi:MAG: hypothetical protein R2939_20440 [Kofleriaceae bacterium]
MPRAANAKLDVLIVLDRSASMAAVNQTLATQFGSVTETLRGALGAELDLHVGLITSDLGALNTLSVGGCEGFGDEGRLLQDASCPRSDGLAFWRDQPAAGGARDVNFSGALGDAVACLAANITQGCGFEQPIAALARAVREPSNASFFRADAVLAAVVVSDEDDCSAASSLLFAPGVEGSPLGPLTSFRCFQQGVECAEPDLRSVGAKSSCTTRVDADLVSAPAELLAEVRAAKGDLDRFFLLTITGPAEPVAVELVDPGSGPTAQLAPSCTSTVGDTVLAAPAIRLIEAAAEVPGRGVSRSLCATDLGAELAASTRSLIDLATARGCLPGEVPDADPAVAGLQTRCHAIAVAADGSRTELAACGTGSTPCVTFEVDAACDHHPTSLRAEVTGDVGAARVAIECELPPT